MGNFPHYLVTTTEMIPERIVFPIILERTLGEGLTENLQAVH